MTQHSILVIVLLAIVLLGRNCGVDAAPSKVDGATVSSNSRATVHLFGTATTDVNFEFSTSTESLALAILPTSATQNTSVSCADGGLVSLGITVSQASPLAVLANTGTLASASLAANNKYRLCSTSGEDIFADLYLGPSVSSSALTTAFGAATTLPSDDTVFPLWTSDTFTIAPSSSSLAAMTTASGSLAFPSAAILYLADTSASCSPAFALAFFSLSSSGGFALSRTELSAAATASPTATAFRLCFAGSNALNLQISPLSSLKAQGVNLNSSTARQYPAHVDKTLTLTLTASIPSGAIFTWGTVYPCSPTSRLTTTNRGTVVTGTPTTSGTDQTTTVAVTPTQVANEVGLCWELGGGDIRMYLNIAVNGFSITSINGVQSSEKVVQVIRPVSAQPSWNWETSGIGSVRGATVYISSSSTCASLSSTSTTVDATTGAMVVPTAWYAAVTTSDSYICISANSSPAFVAGDFLLRVSQIDALTRTGDTYTAAAVFLSGETATLQLAGTVTSFDSLSIGYYSTANGTCVNITRFSSNGAIAVSASALGSTTGTLCVAAGHSFTNAAQFLVLEVSSFGANGVGAMLAGASAQVVPLTVTAAVTAILSQLTFAPCSTTASPITITAFASPYTSLSVAATSNTVGSHQLCWTYGTATAVTLTTLAVLPQPNGNDGLLAVASTGLSQSFTLSFSTSFTSSPSDLKLSVAIATACSSSTTTSGTIEIALFNNISATTLNFTDANSRSSGFYKLCGALLPTSTSSLLKLYPFELGTVGYGAFGIGSATLPFSPVRNVAVDSSSSSDLTLQIATNFPAAATVQFSMTVSTNCEGGTDLGSVSVATGTATNPLVIPAAVFGALNATSSPAVCMRFPQSSGAANVDTGLRVAPVGITTFDGQPFDSSGNSSSVFTVLSSSTRAVSVIGNNLNVAASWSVLLFTASGASCSSTATRTITMTASSPASALFTLPQLTTSQFLTVCLVFSDSLTSTTNYISSGLKLIVSPIVAFESVRTDRVQQPRIIGVNGTIRNINLVMETAASSYTLPLSPRFFLAPGGNCSHSVAFDADRELPVQFDGTNLEIVVNNSDGSIDVGRTEVCSAVTIGGTTLTGSTGIQLSMIKLLLGSFAINSGSIVGATINQPLDLRVTGSFLSDASIYIAATDLTCTSALTGNTAYGNSKSLVQVTGCGSSIAVGTLSAANVKTPTGTSMTLCLAVASSSDSVATSDLVPFDSGVRLSVTEPNAIAVTTQISSRSVDNEGTFATQPVLHLEEASTGVKQGSIPSGLVIKASWFSISPVVEEIGESYEFQPESGSAEIDYSLSSSPVQLKNGKYGFTYVLQFSAIGTLLEAVNSSAVTLGACPGGSTQLAEVYKDTCVACPQNALCDGTINMRVSGSYWRANNLTSSFYSCDVPFMDRSCDSNTSTGTCRAGHSGPRCSVCEEGYANSFDVCVNCDDTGAGVNYFLVILAISVVVLLIGLLILSTLQCKKSDQFPIYIKIFINHLTVSSTLEFSQNLPNAMIQMFKVQRQVSRPSPAFAAFDCVTGTSWYEKFVIVVSIPLGLGLVIALLLQMKKRVQEKEFSELQRKSAAGDLSESEMKKLRSYRRSSAVRSARRKSYMPEEEPPAHTVIDLGTSNAMAQSMDVTSVEMASPAIEKSVMFERPDDEEEPRPNTAESLKPNTSASNVNVEVPTTPAGNPLVDSDEDESDEAMMERDQEGNLVRKKTENLGILQVHGVVQKQHRRHIFAVTMVIILFFTYPSIVEWCANVLKCDEIDFSYPNADGTITKDVRSYFYYDRSRLCTDKTHSNFVIAGLVLGLFYGFGTPILSVLMFRNLRRAKPLGIGNVAASRMFTFLVAGYRRDLWWWEAPMMIKKLLLIYIFAFVSNSRLQTMLAFWVIVCHLVAHAWKDPFEYQVADQMEKASMFAMCVTLNLSLLFEWVSLSSSSTEFVVYAYMLTVVVIFINIIVVLWMLHKIIQEGWVKFTKFLRDEEEWVIETFPNCCVGCLLKFKYSAPTILQVDEDGEAVEVNGDELNEEQRRILLDEDSASDWSSDDDAVQEFGEGGVNDSNVVVDNHSHLDRELVAAMAMAGANVDPGEAASNDPVVLRAVARALRATADDNMKRAVAAQEKTLQSERVLEVFKQQLRVAEDYSSQLEEDLRGQLKALEDTQKSMKELEDEVTVLRGNADPMRSVANDMRRQRDELRKKLAEKDMEGSHVRPPVEDNPSPLTRGASSALFARIGTYRRRIDEIQKTKDSRIRDLENKANFEHKMKQAIMESEKAAQERAIQAQIAAKRQQRQARGSLASRESQQGSFQKPEEAEPAVPTPEAPPAVSGEYSLTGSNLLHTSTKLMLFKNRVQKKRDHPRYKGAWKTFDVQ